MTAGVGNRPGLAPDSPAGGRNGHPAVSGAPLPAGELGDALAAVLVYLESIDTRLASLQAIAGDAHARGLDLMERLAPFVERLAHVTPAELVGAYLRNRRR